MLLIKRSQEASLLTSIPYIRHFTSIFIMKKISLIIPFFNEEAAVANTLVVIENVLEKLPYKFELIAVNDGSTDATLKTLKQAKKSFDLIIVDLSRNFGKEAALSAGLMHASGDAVIPLDADLQDPPELIPQMLFHWEEGFEVVLCQREDRSSDKYLKRNSAALFYKLINRLSEVSIPENVGDFRLMDKVVVRAINQLDENQRFMKGLFAWAGFRTTTIRYTRPERSTGYSKFNAWRLWNLAMEGITSFATLPLRIWTYLGFVVALISAIYALVIVVRTILSGVGVPGYASIFCAILFMSGIQLTGIGMLGEYLGRTYIEAKRRPAYIVREVISSLADVGSEARTDR